MHSAWYQGINSKVVFKITLSSSSQGLAMLPTSSADYGKLLVQVCMLVASEDYNVCFMFNLPCTDIFLEK